MGFVPGLGVFLVRGLWLMHILDWHGWNGDGCSLLRVWGGVVRAICDGIFCTFLLFFVSHPVVPVIGGRPRGHVYSELRLGGGLGWWF